MKSMHGNLSNDKSKLRRILKDRGQNIQFQSMQILSVQKQIGSKMVTHLYQTL